MGSRPVQCRGRYHVPIGRSVTDFMAIRPRKDSLFLLRCMRPLLALNCRDGERLAWQLSGVTRMRLQRGAAAVIDPQQPIAIVNYCTAKGSFDHLVGDGAHRWRWLAWRLDIVTNSGSPGEDYCAIHSMVAGEQRCSLRSALDFKGKRDTLSLTRTMR